MKFFVALMLLVAGVANAQISTNQQYLLNNKFSPAVAHQVQLGDLLAHEDVLKYVDVTLTSAQILALNGTPITVVAAPGSGKAIVVESVYAYNDYVSAAYSAGTDTLDLKYTDGSGATLVSLTNAFLEAAADARAAVHASTQYAVTQNAAVVAYVGTGNPTSGSGTIRLRVFYKVVNF